MIRIFEEELVEVKDGVAYYRITAFYDEEGDEAELPTSRIVNGSFAFDSVNGKLLAFGETNGTWNDICTIGE